jgi:hypothetical protein
MYARPGWRLAMAQLSRHKQYADVFSTAAYPDAVAERFIEKLRSKVQEGLNLRGNRR